MAESQRAFSSSFPTLFFSPHPPPFSYPMCEHTAGSHLQTRKKVLSGKQMDQFPYLGLPASRTMRERISIVAALCLRQLHQQPLSTSLGGFSPLPIASAAWFHIVYYLCFGSTSSLNSMRRDFVFIIAVSITSKRCHQYIFDERAEWMRKTRDNFVHPLIKREHDSPFPSKSSKCFRGRSGEILEE